jgi:hypothetical protein
MLFVLKRGVSRKGMKGKERKGKERKGKERKGKEREYFVEAPNDAHTSAKFLSETSASCEEAGTTAQPS